MSGPFIFAMIVPLVILDIAFEIYHRVCFPLYKIPLVKRSKYIKIDRYKLSYLRPEEKMYCMYCGYGNGLIYYVWTIMGRTERYWCGIKHKRDDDFNEPPHHESFLEYGDEKSFNSFVEKVKKG
jgi:hypothetical protein